jgi:hypothetical protein
MPVVRIREVRVAVGERGVFMNMVVRSLPVPGLAMRVLMVQVMGVRMSMLHGAVPVSMRMPLRQVQPDAKGHE